jgi:outer membrane receptor protein involved in Fe transport
VVPLHVFKGSLKMKMSTRHALCWFGAAAGVVAVPHVALAASPEGTQAGRQIEELVVTAQRRKQSLQDVPFLSAS